MSDTTAAIPAAASIAAAPPADLEALAALVPDPVPAKSTALPGAERTSEPVAPTVHEDTAEAKEEAPAAPEPDTSALERAEAAARRAREGSRRYREMQRQAEERQREVQRAAQEAQRLRQEAEQARHFQAQLRSDPYKALKGLGMTDQELAERALREGTPEAVLHELKATLEQERQARLQLEQSLQQERQDASRRSAEQAFATLADDETAYPRLSELSHRAQLAVAKEALQQIADNGYDPSVLSDEEVAEACERFLAPKKGRAAATPKPAPAPKKTSGKTLTNSVSTERAVSPKDWSEMSEDEMIALIAASLPDPV